MSDSTIMYPPREDRVELKMWQVSQEVNDLIAFALRDNGPMTAGQVATVVIEHLETRYIYLPPYYSRERSLYGIEQVVGAKIFAQGSNVALDADGLYCFREESAQSDDLNYTSRR